MYSYSDHELRHHIIAMTEGNRQASRALRERDLAGHCMWSAKAQRHYRLADDRLQALGVDCNDQRQVVIHNTVALVFGGRLRRVAVTRTKEVARRAEAQADRIPRTHLARQLLGELAATGLVTLERY